MREAQSLTQVSAGARPSVSPDCSQLGAVGMSDCLGMSASGRLGGGHGSRMRVLVFYWKC